MRNKSQIINHKSQIGFTLVEVMVTVFGFTLVSFGVVALVSALFTGSTQQGNLLAASDQARKLSFQFSYELRNARTSSTGSYALAQADNQQIIFFSNIDGGNDVERVRYFISSGKLYKGIVKPTGSPYSYNVANERTSVVQDNVANGATPLFYYYNGDYNGVSETPLSQPVSVVQVKFVKMNLKIANKGGVDNTATYTVTASAAIRNLKSNLGE